MLRGGRAGGHGGVAAAPAAEHALEFDGGGAFGSARRRSATAAAPAAAATGGGGGGSAGGCPQPPLAGCSGARSRGEAAAAQELRRAARSGGGGGGGGAAARTVRGVPRGGASAGAAFSRNVRRSGELNLSLDGVGVSRTPNGLDDDGVAAGANGAVPSDRRKVRGSGSASITDALHETTQGGNLKALEELRTEELRTLPALPPDATMKSVLDQLRSDDWSAHFDAINLLRRHVAWLDEGNSDGGLGSNLHSINLLLITYADSLRSALAKNAVVCFRELFFTLGHKMKADLDLIVPVLIKKAGESNGFICDEANKALAAMVQSVSESRAIAALLGSASHRNPPRAPRRRRTSPTLELMGYGRLLHSRELERVLLLPTLLSEGLSETRAAAKQIIFNLTREALVADETGGSSGCCNNLSEPRTAVRESIELATSDAMGPNGGFLAGAVRMSGGVGGVGRKALEGRRGGGGGGGGGGGSVEGDRGSCSSAASTASDTDSSISSLSIGGRGAPPRAPSEAPPPPAAAPTPVGSMRSSPTSARPTGRCGGCVGAGRPRRRTGRHHLRARQAAQHLRPPDAAADSNSR